MGTPTSIDFRGTEFRLRQASFGLSSEQSMPHSRQFAGMQQLLLVEDSAVLSERIAEVLRDSPGIELVGIVDTEKAAVASIERDRIDIVVLDLHLKQGTGFGVLRAIGALQNKPRVIILTNYDLPEYKQAAISLGAAHFLDKALDYARLPDVLREMSAARA